MCLCVCQGGKRSQETPFDKQSVPASLRDFIYVCGMSGPVRFHRAGAGPVPDLSCGRDGQTD